MPTICFLSMDDIVDKSTEMEVDDDLAIEPLQQLGWDVQVVCWRTKTISWKQFDAVIVRSTWDYQDNATAFLETLRTIEQQTRLENPLEIVEWNLSKIYLQELETKGVPIVPTVFSKEPIILWEPDDVGNFIQNHLPFWNIRLDLSATSTDRPSLALASSHDLLNTPFQ